MKPEEDFHLEELGMALAVTASRFARTAAALANTPASSATWRTLSLINQMGPISISSLAQLEKSSLPTVTTSTKRLVEMALLTRTHSPEDHRTVLLQITSKGQAELAKWSHKLGESLEPELKKLAHSELATLAKAQKIMAKIIESQQEKKP